MPRKRGSRLVRRCLRWFLDWLPPRLGSEGRPQWTTGSTVWRSTPRSDCRGVHRSGLADGSRNIPDRQAPLAPPEVNVVRAEALQADEAIERAWRRIDAPLAAVQHRRQALYVRAQENERRTAQALVRANQNAKEVTDAAAAESRDQRLKGRGGLARRWRMHPAVFWLLVGLVAAGEYPLSQAVFGDLDTTVAWSGSLVAASVALLLVAASKLLGIFAVRLAEGPDWRHDRAAVVAMVGLTAVTVAACAAMTVLRVQYVESSSGRTAAELQEFATALGVDAPETSLSPPRRSTHFAAYLSLLLLSVVVGGLLSFLAHDPAKGLTRRGRRSLERHARQARRRLAAARHRYRRATVRRQAAYEYARSDAEELLGWYRSAVSQYWSANFHARREPVTEALYRLAQETGELSPARWRGEKPSLELSDSSWAEPEGAPLVPLFGNDHAPAEGKENDAA